VTAVTRHPDGIPPRAGLQVAQGDAADPGAASVAVAGSDAVVSALGAPYSRRPVSLYSAGTASIITAMRDHGLRRLVVAGTAAADPVYHGSNSLLFSRVMEPLFMRRPGRTVYDDNRRMEAAVQASGLDWTIVRACRLFNSAGISDYLVCEGSPHDDRSPHDHRHPKHPHADLARGSKKGRPADHEPALPAHRRFRTRRSSPASRTGPADEGNDMFSAPQSCDVVRHSCRRSPTEPQPPGRDTGHPMSRTGIIAARLVSLAREVRLS
jgi:hypothetical protein